ncbi:hypothetical protein PybrP1_003340 [[Pythium] brassicae (nom. inval.)]|nr:hypothetical protein PybrP1_003340 [[Pythium] brassicae (nom. inval.)]
MVADFTQGVGYAGYGTPARTFVDHLPRRSSLADASISLSTNAEADADAATASAGRHTLDPFTAAESPGMRHIHQLRPVASLEAAAAQPFERNQPRDVPTVDPARSYGLSIVGNDERSTSTGGFSLSRVRLQDAWHTDMWLYMKNAHPVIGIFEAHERHPYKRKDRLLVLLVALLVLFVLCGVFATRECCDLSPEVLVATASHRGLATSTSRSLARSQECAPFYSGCDSVSTLCTAGSVCAPSSTASAGTQCVPTAATAAGVSCADDVLSCPDGWSCDVKTRLCAPSTSLVCYVGRASAASAPSEVAADGDTDNDGDDSGVSVFEAILGILIVANGNGTDRNITGNGSTPQPTPLATVAPAPARIATLPQSLSVALVAPVDGGVYSVHSRLPIEWTIRALEGGAQPLRSFSVALSADGRPFSTVAADVRASESDKGDSAVSVYRYDWDLNGDPSRLCTKCVLRVCGDVADGGQQVCIRSDGGGSGAAQPTGVAFQIVSDGVVVSCACGLAHAPFVELSYVIALCVPLTVLLLQQFVTFYEDAKLCGLCERRGHDRSRESRRRMPLCAYSARGATRVGRVVVVLLLAAAGLSCGFLFARLTEARFFDQTSKIALLWLGMYGLSLLVAFVYCSALWLAIFSVWWRHEAIAKDSLPPQQQQQRRHRRQQYQHPDAPIMQSDRIVQMSDFVFTRRQREQQTQREHATPLSLT